MPRDYSAEINYPEEEAVDYREFDTEGEMEEFEVGGKEILIVHTSSGEVRAIPASCPHQEHALVEGELDGDTLTCAAHLWQFDVITGKGINPDDAELCLFAVKVENGDIFVDVNERMKRKS